MKTQNKVLLFVLLFLPVLSSAQGFYMNNQGVKASGMGGFSAAAVNDASAAYFNPAAISRIETSQITAGIGVVFPRISYLDPYSGNVDMDPAISLPFNVYGIAAMKGKLSAGVGIYTPYSENIAWEDNWSGRFIVIKNRFRSLNIQPVISYKLGDHFSLGAGPVISWAGLKRTVALDITSSTFANAITEHKSASTGFGFTAAALLNFDALSIGVTYHSAIDHKMKNGETEFKDISESAALVEGLPSTGEFTTEVTLPSSIDVGIAYKLNEKLQIMANGNYTFWSSSEFFDLIYADELMVGEPQKLNYEDALSLSAGGNFKYTEKTSFRAGIGWTKSHVPDGFLSPAHPDADQLIYSGGLSYLWKEGVTLDFSLMVKDYKSRKEAANMLGNFNGEYKSTLYIAGIGINYEF
jgi:long-chain fatty acid transport protein